MTQLLVAAYVVVFTIMMEKGYQHTAPVSGTTSIKLKGTASIGNASGPRHELIPLDAMDLVQPQIEENAFFLVTARYNKQSANDQWCNFSFVYIPGSPLRTKRDSVIVQEMEMFLNVLQTILLFVTNGCTVKNHRVFSPEIVHQMVGAR